MTLRHPWAALAVLGRVPVLSVPFDDTVLRPRYVAIHAGQETDTAAFERAAHLGLSPLELLASCPHGAIVAVARVRYLEVLAPALGVGWALGPLCMGIADVLPIEPVACWGHPGVWPLEDALRKAVSARYGEARRERAHAERAWRWADELDTLFSIALVREQRREERGAAPTWSVTVKPAEPDVAALSQRYDAIMAKKHELLALYNTYPKGERTPSGMVPFICPECGDAFVWDIVSPAHVCQTTPCSSA